MAVTYWDPQSDYRGFLIHRTESSAARLEDSWTWAHAESALDGPDCLGYGHAADPEQCRIAIDEWWEDQDAMKPQCNECDELEETCPNCRLNAAFATYRKPC